MRGFGLAVAVAVLAAAGCSRERIDEGTGGAESAEGSVDAYDAATAASATDQPLPNGDVRAPDAATTSAVPPGDPDTAPASAGVAAAAAAGPSATDAPALGATDSTPRPRGIEGVGAVEPGTSGVDASARPPQ